MDNERSSEERDPNYQPGEEMDESQIWRPRLRPRRPRPVVVEVSGEEDEGEELDESESPEERDEIADFLSQLSHQDHIQMARILVENVDWNDEEAIFAGYLLRLLGLEEDDEEILNLGRTLYFRLTAIEDVEDESNEDESGNLLDQDLNHDVLDRIPRCHDCDWIKPTARIRPCQHFICTDCLPQHHCENI